MSSTKIQKLSTAAFANGTPKNFMTTAEARCLVAEAKRDGKVTKAERDALGSHMETAAWTYYDDKAFGSTKPFDRPTMSMGAGSILKAYRTGWDG
jgi:hypothetical protein